MPEKTLHTANIAAAFGVMATTAADLTFFGGTATTIGAALSGLSLFKSANDPTKALAKDMLQALKHHAEHTHLSTDRRKILVQMLHRFKPDNALLATCGVQPTCIADAMREIVKDATTDTAYQTEQALTDFHAAIVALFTVNAAALKSDRAVQGEMLADQTGRLDRMEALLREREKKTRK